MTVSLNPNGPAVPPPRESQGVNRAEAGAPKELSIREQVKQSANAAIMQANQQVSLQAGNEPLALLYTAAIDAINEKLAPSLGENALQRGLDEGLDVSPEATAERIVSLTTGLFSRYQDSNPELDFSAQVERFVEVISGGIEQGFNEARDILDGLNVLEGDIAANIDTTYELVQQGLQAFVDQMLGLDSGPDSEQATEA
ncbi:MAG: DUF5610 domain-containing protein [Halopseudomonas sp.]